MVLINSKDLGTRPLSSLVRHSKEHYWKPLTERPKWNNFQLKDGITLMKGLQCTASQIELRFVQFSFDS